MKKIKFKKINNKLNFKSLKKIELILKTENRTSIAANLSRKNFNKYLSLIIKSKNFELFLIFFKKNVIGYAILVKKPIYLIDNFTALKFNFFFDLLLNLNFISIINIILSMFNLDNLIISKTKTKILSESLNLNLLAIEQKYQSKGFGKKFLEYIIKNTNFKSRYLTCETDNSKSTNFYIKKLKFKKIGNKIRFSKTLQVLAKRL